jgi:type II restriction enzyme
MSKTDDAVKILTLMGVPKAQRNERSAKILLAILNIREKTPWKNAEGRSIGIHGIIGFFEENYGKKYAENTRETIRKHTLHQFEHAGIIIKNPDKSRPTTSPDTVYEITPEALILIKSFESPQFENQLNQFVANHGKLIEKYSGRKHSHDLTVKFKDEIFTLSSGKHNELQISILSDLHPRFFPNAELLYLGDTANKLLKFDEDLVKELKLPFNAHDKLPDVIFFDREKNHLLIVEAVESSGPMDHTRHQGITEILTKSGVKGILISAFQTKKAFKKYIEEIAWETEVWIAEEPEHMIHFNGPKFLFCS